MFEFDNDHIDTIQSQTGSHQTEWDTIWNGVRAQLGATVSTALDALPAGSLDDRTLAYHRKTAQYLDGMGGLQACVKNIGVTSVEANDAMYRSIARA
ncbi:MAG: hypothetical protein ACR2F6_04785 [Mycobacteriales bacterium]